MAGQHGGGSRDDRNQTKWPVLAGEPRLDGGVTLSSTLNMRVVHQNETFDRASRDVHFVPSRFVFHDGMTSVASCLEAEVTLASATHPSSCLLRSPGPSQMHLAQADQ